MYLKSKILKQFPNLIHGFTTRDLGADYERIAQVINLPVSSILTLKQIHSNKVFHLNSPSLDERGQPKAAGGWPENESIEGDAIVTNQQGTVIGIRTADCVPILVYDPKQKAIAAIHAGWRGLIAGIIENAIDKMKREFGSSPESLIVAMGPALCMDCFEVGPEVAEKFAEKFGSKISVKKGKGDRMHPDFKKGCHLVLNDLGIKEENIDILPYCTSCQNDLLFSYRRGDKEGRMLCFISLK